MIRITTLCLALALCGIQDLLAAEFTTRTLNADAAWCWFQDERALMMNDSVVFGSITSSGTVQATSYNWRSGDLHQTTLHEKFHVDDHNVPGMLTLADGRLMAFYCQHHVEPVLYTRQTRTAESAVDWLPEQTFDAALTGIAKFTYANPIQLSAENNRIYFFWRALDFNPTVTWSDDGGKTWAKGQNAIYFKKGQRPYVKYTSNGRDTIHFAYTNAHPRNYENNIYHALYRNGQLLDSSGTVVRRLEEGPLNVEEGTRVYSAEEAGKAWIWDVHLEKDGSPVMVFATVPTIEDHRYRYARWNPDTRQWTQQEIAYAGQGLYDKEREYSGGICLDPDDLSVVYLSANVDPQTGKKTGTGKYEIYRGKTPDGGKNWSWEALTENSSEDNLRPIVPAGRPGEVFVLWMQGRYPTYSSYDTQIVLGRD